jgi:hypothetical protein
MSIVPGMPEEAITRELFFSARALASEIDKT